MYLAGVDGGATSTKCLVVDETGRVISSAKGGPSNHVFGEKGILRLQEALEGSLGSAIADLNADFLDGIGFGMTGLKKGDRSKQVIVEVARKCASFDDSIVVEDIKIALAGAVVEGPGVIAYAGTGANTYGKDREGNEAKVGGWGHIIDDKGAGYDIGRLALRMAFRSLDGRCESTCLTEMLLEHFDCDSMREVRNAVYRNGGLDRPEIGALSKLVSQGAEAGDEVCQEILCSSGETLAETVVAALNQLNTDGPPFPVFTAGGVFNAGSWILDPLVDTIKSHFPRIQIKEPQFPPVAGAVFLACRQKGITPDSNFIDNLRSSLPEEFF
ncbi:MAG: BadF/BadG/BcrA/BcrD ATPase family protein [Candidatus Bipolaricaulota bacterium]